MRPPADISIDGWQTVYSIDLPSREQQLFEIADLGFERATTSFLTRNAPKGVYLHQREAMRQFKKGKNVCITTGTASGKSLIFYMSALEILSSSPGARILAIYPTKALATEQEQRWRDALRVTSLQAEVGRIEGGVPVHTRAAVIKRSSVLIMTPDVIHAWLLSNLSDNAVISFLRKLSLIIVDEVHNYTGVFGSNSGFLFRRIQHVMSLLHASAQYICASATIAEPVKHLQNLFGQDFHLIEPELDTSPRYPVTIKLMSAITADDQLTSV
jgi:DEAD/DEAH box helicase domain-containing protein